jgi:hypothetical protein
LLLLGRLLEGDHQLMLVDMVVWRWTQRLWWARLQLLMQWQELQVLL